MQKTLQCYLQYVLWTFCLLEKDAISSQNIVQEKIIKTRYEVAEQEWKLSSRTPWFLSPNDHHLIQFKPNENWDADLAVRKEIKRGDWVAVTWKQQFECQLKEDRIGNAANITFNTESNEEADNTTLT